MPASHRLLKALVKSRVSRTSSTDGDITAIIAAALALMEFGMEKFPINPILTGSLVSSAAAHPPATMPKQTIKNTIEVITQGDNFRRAVKVEGSP
jgi:hypothetical protein